MNFHKMLTARAETHNPVRVGLIGAGKFGTMFLSQARITTGLHVVGIADLNLTAARNNALTAGWTEQQISATDVDEARRAGTTHLTDEVENLLRAGQLEVVIEATGQPGAGIRHCRRAIREGIHVIMVNVEADAVAGPLLAREARAANVIYSLAWGDQPALICEHVDWARTCGFNVVCAGKGTRYHPDFHQSTPETVWEHFDVDADAARRSGMNPKMFNSFIDGTKSAIEMTAVCNATGLRPQREGLGFPPASCRQLADVCKPQPSGGVLSRTGTTEVVSSLNRDLAPVKDDLMYGTYVVIEADNRYTQRCFQEYRMLPDATGRYAALFRPTHMIGLELGVSVASVVLCGQPTGTPAEFLSDVVAVTKKPLNAGEVLDGEGGFCVWGKQIPAETSLRMKALPIGLAHDLRLARDVAKGQILGWSDVDYDTNADIVTTRRQMEDAFGT